VSGEANGSAYPVCSRCRFWSRVDESDGECRRREPTLVWAFGDLTSAWPITDAAEWCGEWRPVTAEPDASA